MKKAYYFLAYLAFVLVIFSCESRQGGEQEQIDTKVPIEMGDPEATMDGDFNDQIYFVTENISSKNLEEMMGNFSRHIPGVKSLEESKSLEPIFTLGDIKYKHEKIQIKDSTYYLVEGDLLMDEKEYFQYVLHRSMQQAMQRAQPDTIRESEKLVGIVQDGRLVRWPADMVLKYAVVKTSFPTITQYNQAKDLMAQAVAEWENTINIRFEHAKERDEEFLWMPDVDLTFIVSGYNSGGQFLASAFFPHQPEYRRKVLIDPTFFSSMYDKKGILTHELGHVLGFRHEHIRPQAPLACPNEILAGTYNITDYDPRSVMHYFCGGAGTVDLSITDVDRRGAQYLYGSPNGDEDKGLDAFVIEDSAALESSVAVVDPYWFYSRNSPGGFYDRKGYHYSQILQCSQKVTTPGIFDKRHAVGPFETYMDAMLARKYELEAASLSGQLLIPETAVCDTRWD